MMVSNPNGFSFNVRGEYRFSEQMDMTVDPPQSVRRWTYSYTSAVSSGLQPNFPAVGVVSIPGMNQQSVLCKLVRNGYFAHIRDVPVDGNCGYRVLVEGLKLCGIVTQTATVGQTQLATSVRASMADWFEDNRGYYMGSDWCALRPGTSAKERSFVALERNIRTPAGPNSQENWFTHPFHAHLFVDHFQVMLLVLPDLNARGFHLYFPSALADGFPGTRRSSQYWIGRSDVPVVGMMTVTNQGVGHAKHLVFANSGSERFRNWLILGVGRGWITEKKRKNFTTTEE
jgi:hypothetical protein